MFSEIRVARLGVGGPTTLSARSLAPDLARGTMLLGIALAHAPAYLYAREIGLGGYPVDGGLADKIVALVEGDLVVGRVYPMFAALFGYGLVQLLNRQLSEGADPVAVRKLIRRRGLWLVAFGFVHALLLWAGDILGAYGVVAIVVAGMVLRVRDRTIAIVAALSVILAASGGAAVGLPVPQGQESALLSTSEADLLRAAVTRLAEWAPSLVFQPLGLVGAVLLGVWAGRRRVLDEPERHRRFLARVAVAGLALAAVGGLPMALMGASVWQDPPALASALAGALQYASGYGGVGYAALVGLVAIRFQDRQGPVVTAIAACGQRSLSCYLAQSLVLVPVLASYGGALGSRVGVAATALLAVLTWALTVVGADVMRRHRYRGPAETLLRRLTYGRHEGGSDDRVRARKHR